MLFDGVCNFCNFWINFVLKKDRNKIFLFATLQSNSGQNYLKAFDLNLSQFETFIVVKDEHYYTKSEAVLIIAENLPYPYKFLKYCKFIPKWIRDWIYSIFARNRYKIFGKREVCHPPDQGEVNRFLT